MKKGGNLKTIFKESATISAGAFLGIIPQLLIGSLILILGIYLVQLDDKKKIENKSLTHGYLFYLGLILVVFGAVLSLNMVIGVDFVIDQLSN